MSEIRDKDIKKKNCKNIHMKSGQKEKVRSLTRGLEILNCFHDSSNSLSLTDICEKIKLSPSTTSRLLTTLVEENYLRKDISKRYSIGSKIIKFADLVINEPSLHTKAVPVLENLRDMFDETVSMYIPQGDMRVCIEALDSNNSLKRSVPIGETLPLSRGAMGSVLLAWLPYVKRKEIIDKNPHLSERFLSQIRKDGYCINDGLQEKGVFSISAPIFNVRGQNIAAIAISAPSFRVDEEKRNEMIETIKKYSILISNLPAILESKIDSKKETE